MESDNWLSGNTPISFIICPISEKKLMNASLFRLVRCIHASLQEALSVGPSVTKCYYAGNEEIWSKKDENIKYTLNIHFIGALLVHSFVCLSVSQSISTSICPLVGSPVGLSTGYALYRNMIQKGVNTLNIHFIEALSVHSFVCLSVSQSIH